MGTRLTSSGRSTQSQLEKDIQSTRKLPLIEDLTRLISDAFVILNQNREIVYCNTALVQALGANTPEQIYGKRLGEAFNCVHAFSPPDGCGTTEFCKVCGAATAIQKSQSDINQLKQDECRLRSKSQNESFDFLIRARTMAFDDVCYTLLVVRDIGSEKRKQILERIFFHDIINTAGALQGLIDLMREAESDEREEYISLAELSSNTLIEEIGAQKDLVAAENNQLEIEPSLLDPLEILVSVQNIYKNHKLAMDKTIQIDPNSADHPFSSDARLLMRIIGNMTKNALEAEPAGATITLGAVKQEGQMIFRVCNPTPMPDTSKKQVFQRSFSTKGPGRGLGTYSIKLLGEKYLKGTVSFSSETDDGTCFQVSLPLDA